MNLNFRFISHTLKSNSTKTINFILVKILVVPIKHPVNIYKLTVVNLRKNSLTLSLEENLMHRGSSLMIFFTSFHVDVKVIFERQVNKKT